MVIESFSTSQSKKGAYARRAIYPPVNFFTCNIQLLIETSLKYQKTINNNKNNENSLL